MSLTTNASRTQLFDINAQVWSEELLAYFDIPQVILPEVMDSAAHFAVANAKWSCANPDNRCGGRSASCINWPPF